MGTLETPQDRHREIHKTGLQSGADRRRPRGAGSSGGQGRWSLVAVASSLGPATTAGTFVPPPKKIHGAAQGYQEPSGAKHTRNNDLKRPWSQSCQIRPRPAGETITGWLNHSTAGAGGLEEATAGGGPSDRGWRVGLPRELEGAADGGLAFPTDGGVISRERRGR